MGYSTKIKINKNKKRTPTSRVRKRTRRNYATKGWQKKFKKFKLDKFRSAKVKKALYTGGGILLIATFIGLIFALSYVQSLTEDLPSPDKPFGNRNTASEMYDKNGKLLYRVFGDENSDPVDIDKVPHLLKWSFLAAEDIDFYKHPGFDVTAILRCAVRNFQEGQTACGGSTITQQLIKQTALTNEQRLERKLKELILAMQIEKDRSKDEILEMYLTVSPEGSNIYGITTAAEFYFGKDLEELNLAEMAILASIPQDPTRLSPTKSANPEESQKAVKQRQEYVLDQMERYMDEINDAYKEDNDTDDEILSQDIIDEAREYKLKYREPIFDIEAPHFVFYAQKLLQERDYNDGVPFTLSELETGGYKIYTTLDLDIQLIAEEQVRDGVDTYGSQYGGENAALIAIQPKTGNVLAMVGSYDYFGKPTPENCTLGVSCRFEPNVNITDTLQSPGSSMKPMVYYMAMMDGIISPGSIIPDIPIKIGNYEPKNYEGGFIGMQPARKMLADSRNIPAIYLLDELGVEKYIGEMKKWGYSTLNNPNGYGSSAAVGGVDVKLIEHAQAYTVFANEGKLTTHEVISKIEDKDGNVIFEAEPQTKSVADPRGVYLVNHILNGKNGGPGVSWDGRDIAGKTGTAENQEQTLFATYTPEIIAVGFLGNNDNTPMRYGAGGFGTARPWVAKFVERVGGSFPATPFPRPEGITTKGVCSSGENATCSGYASDLSIASIKVPSYVKLETAVVCKDQQNKLAREIDISVGKSKTKTFKIFTMPNKSLQGFLDSFLKKNGNLNIIPDKYCDINRNPSGNLDPWAVITSPSATEPLGDTLTINVQAFSASADVTKVEVYLDGAFLGESTTLPYQDTFNIGAQSPGSHLFEVKVFDSAGEEGTTTRNLETLGELSITAPVNGSTDNPVNVNYSYTGTSIGEVKLFVDDVEMGTCSAGVCTWTPTTAGTYTVHVTGVQLGNTITSNPKEVIITL